MKSLSETPIAIVGTSCRFPKAENMHKLWDVLVKGKSVIGKVPADRWDMDLYYHPEKGKPNKTNQNVGGFLDTIHSLDAKLFRISPKEAYEMSPSQKLALELAWELIENSTIPYNKFIGSHTGVYIGNIWADFEHYRKQRNAEINNFSGLGQSNNIIANRISYFFGLTGPSYTLDTGCSSSLIALMQCVESLQHGKIEMGIAGGVNHILNPDQYIYLAKFGGLSSKGRCYSFDEEADGFVRSEGAALVLLKTLEAAERDKDDIHAVICGGAFNNNGFNTNMPATSKKGQYHLLKQAYEQSGVHPRDIDYIETHGTGTRLGDPVEAEALGDFFGKIRTPQNPLLIGSVKSNIGHTEASSGIAGLLKVVLAMQHGMIPGNLGYKKPNPKIDFKNWNIEIVKENTRWRKKSDQLLFAGVSSFGWGGSNAHVVLQNYSVSQTPGIETVFTQKQYFLPVSASSESVLKQYAHNIASFTNQHVGSSIQALRKFCVNFAMRKPGLEYRKMFMGSDLNQLQDKLLKYASSLTIIEPVSPVNRGGKVFVFSGQGSQWHTMGRALYNTEKVYQEAFDACDKALQRYSDIRLIDELHGSEEQSKLKHIDVIQPFIFSVQVSLAKLWISMGVEPNAIVGHSMGEVSAAYIAGILSLDDAALIIGTRSKLMGTLSGKGGAMLLIGLGAHKTRELLGNTYNTIEISVNNSPKASVVSGSEMEIGSLFEALEAQDIFCRKVNVDVASHSSQMDAILPRLASQLSSINPVIGKYPMYSTVTKRRIGGKEMDAKYWVENLRNTVFFEPVIDKLIEEGHSLFIEISPHPILRNAVYECAEKAKAQNVASIGSIHREYADEEEFYKNFAQVFEKGHDIHWKTYYNIEQIAYVDLPAYPMERDNYQLKDRSNLLSKSDVQDVSFKHPLLVGKLELAESASLYFKSKLSLNLQPFIEQHQVNGRSTLPAAFYIEVVAYLVKKYFPKQRFSLHRLSFTHAVTLKDDQVIDMQIKIDTDQGEPKCFNFFKSTDTSDDWELCCSGYIQEENTNRGIPEISVNESDYFDKKSVYRSLRNIGVDYRKDFTNVVSVTGGNNCYEAIIHLEENTLDDNYDFAIHPILIDNALHPLFVNTFTRYDGTHLIFITLLGIEEILFPTDYRFTNRNVVKLSVNAKQEDDTFNYLIQGTIQVYNNEGQLVLLMTGVSANVADTGIEKPKRAKGDSKSLVSKIVELEDGQEKTKLIQEYLIALIASLTKASRDSINSRATFNSMGIDSLTMVQLWNVIEKEFGVSVSLKDFTKFPSPNSFARYLNELLHMNKLSVPDKSDHDPWLIRSRKSKNIRHQLVLLYDAGGTSRLFKDWDVFLPDDVELLIIELPGHGGRIDEPLVKQYDQLLDYIIPKLRSGISKPFSIFGHSMGGVLAFEIACKLYQQSDMVSNHLFLSGTPYVYGYTNSFINSIIEGQDIDSELLKLIEGVTDHTSEQAVQSLVRILRADFELLYHYPYNNNAVLMTPITAIHAVDDDRVAEVDVKKWRKATQKNFSLAHIQGGHNAIYISGKQVAERVGQTITQYELQNSDI